MNQIYQFLRSIFILNFKLINFTFFMRSLSKENLFSHSKRVTHRSISKSNKRNTMDRFIPKIFSVDYERSNSLDSLETRTLYEEELQECLFEKQEVRSYALSHTVKKGKKDSEKVGQKQREVSCWKTLGIPGWRDNYYSNLLDWSWNNFLCIAYNHEAFLYNMSIMDDDGTPNYKKYKMNEKQALLTSIKSSPNGNKIAVGFSNGSFKVYDYFVGKFYRQYKLHEARIASINWSGNLITGSKDQTIKIVDLRMNTQSTLTPKCHCQEICGIKQQGYLLASGGNDNQVYLYDLRKKAVLDTYSHGAAIKALAWLNDGKTLVSGGGTADKKIKFWKDTEGVYNEVDTGSQVCSLLASKNTNQIISCQGFSLNQIVIWNYEGNRQYTLHGHSSRVLYSALSPKGNLFASGAGDQTLKIWKAFPLNQKVSELNEEQLR